MRHSIEPSFFLRRVLSCGMSFVGHSCFYLKSQLDVPCSFMQDGSKFTVVGGGGGGDYACAD